MKRLLFSVLAAVSLFRLEAVTLNVSVPPATKSCYVAGAFNNWNAGEALQMLPDGENHFTIDLPEVSDSDIAQGYKYLSGPAWKYVEKGADGEEIGNRTSPGEDVVGSWAALFNPDIKNIEVDINGYKRILRVALPEDYDSSDKNYPVVYMIGVQQRYSAAGSDDAGDDFFGPDSWNMMQCISDLKTNTGENCIVAALYTFVAESIPYETVEFVGSGDADNFLDDYLTEVVGFVNQNFRVNSSVDNTTLVGADLGGNLALYATIKYPQTFGKCVAMSPMLWINRDQMIDLAKSATNSRFVLSYGSEESSVIKDDVQSFVSAAGENASVVEIKNGLHDDTTWGAAIPAISPFFVSGDFTLPAEINVSTPAPSNLSICNFDIQSADLSFYYTEASSTPVLDSSVSFSYIDNFVSSSGSRSAVMGLVKDISKSFKSKCYWNVMDNSTGQFLSDNGNVSFSSKKSAESWLRIIVYEDGSTKGIAASSIGFRAVAADETVLMTPSDNHHAHASVKFSGSDKSFTIHYGSVNSQSDMGEVSTTFYVSDECIEASIDYDFLTNDVVITETKWGRQMDNIVIEYFKSVPAVTTVGQSALVSVKLDSQTTPILTVSHNYMPEESVQLTPDADGQWSASLNSLSQGIHYVTLSARRDDTVKDNVAQIAIRVLDVPASNEPTQLTVNTYENVDWEATGRYKANFHTHTSQSFDTSFATHQVVDLYHSAGYSILALTDHDFNPYPWNLFDLFNPAAQSRDPQQLEMLAIPGNELSKDNNNSWSESTGGDFNHHNDFFTGRKGQEFATLRESYAYTQALGGMQIINHPGQYWSLDKEYIPGEKNSPEWHVQNFQMFESLIGLEVYNQGNRRPNDRILWDQILEMTMPARPVWGYSCDDTHTREQYFRNYQFMLMPSLSVENLKDAMRAGRHFFSYEFTGSGEAKAPHINEISVNPDNSTISIETNGENDEIYWIFATDKKDGAAPSTRKSTVVGIGKTFDFTGFKGNYVRALVKNSFGETCTQPFGFSFATGVETILSDVNHQNITIAFSNANRELSISSTSSLSIARVYTIGGQLIVSNSISGNSAIVDLSSILPGVYVVEAIAEGETAFAKIIVK